MKKALLVAALLLLAGCGATPTNPTLYNRSVAFSQQNLTFESLDLDHDSILRLLEDVKPDDHGRECYNYAADKDPLKAALQGLDRLKPLFGTIRTAKVTKKAKEDNDHGRYYHITFALKLNNGQAGNLTIDVLREFYGDDFEDSGIYKAVDAEAN